MLNSFQLWAINYATAHGFEVITHGNWVILIKDETEIECMSEQGVRDACSSSR